MEIGVGFSQHEDPERAGAEAATMARERVAQPRLAVVFGSTSYEQERLAGGILRALPGVPIVGATSFAEVSNVGVTEDSVVVALLEPTPGRVVTGFRPCSGLPEATGFDVGHSLRDGAADGDVMRTVLAFCDMSFGSGDEYVRGIRRALDTEDVTFFGGSSSFDLERYHETGEAVCKYVYTGEGARATALSSAMLSFPRGGDVTMAFGFAHGWTPLSAPMTITRAEGPTVFEVDGRPVFDYYASLLGEHFSKRLRTSAGRYCMLVEFDQGGCHGVDVRNPAFFDEERGAIGFFPPDSMEGLRFRLAQCSRTDLVTGARGAARDCRAALGSAHPRLVLMVSCGARRDILHSRQQVEFEAVHEVFGPDVPIVGYYGGGEIGPTLSTYEDATTHCCGGRLPLHHAVSLCLLALGTREPAPTIDEASRLRRRATCCAPSAEVQVERLQRMLDRCEDFVDETVQVLSGICIQNRDIGEDLAQAKDILEVRNEKLLDANERYENLQDILRRYTPHAIWRKAGHSVEKGRYEIDNEELELTFMFLDVKGFTSYAEAHAPDEVIAAINRIFEPITDIVYDRGGDIDKFIGDAILATFVRTDDAVAAAKRILEFMRDHEADVHPFRIRMGINRGRVVLGNVGAARRMDHTLIGDAVNLAQRLEANCEPGRCLVSSAVFDASVVPFRNLQKRQITVKGKADPVIVYECWL